MDTHSWSWRLNLTHVWTWVTDYSTCNGLFSESLLKWAFLTGLSFLTHTLKTVQIKTLQSMVAFTFTRAVFFFFFLSLWNKITNRLFISKTLPPPLSELIIIWLITSIRRHFTLQRKYFLFSTQKWLQQHNIYLMQLPFSISCPFHQKQDNSSPCSLILTNTRCLTCVWSP